MEHDLDPGPFDIFNVPRYDQGDFWKLVACVLGAIAFLLFIVIGKPSSAQNANHQYAVVFKCPTGKMVGGVSTDDTELLLAATLVYLGKIHPEQFLAFIDDPNVRNNAINWMKTCLGIEAGKEM